MTRTLPPATARWHDRLAGLGFTANRVGTAPNNPPTAFTLNGAACAVG